MINEDFDGRLSGRFVLKHIFEIADQIHTLHSRRISTKDFELIVAQPDGNLLRFNPNEDNSRRSIFKRFSFQSKCLGLGGILATDMSNHGVQGWTEAIALDRFSEETVYATICQGMKIYPSI